MFLSDSFQPGKFKCAIDENTLHVREHNLYENTVYMRTHSIWEHMLNKNPTWELTRYEDTFITLESCAMELTQCEPIISTNVNTIISTNVDLYWHKFTFITLESCAMVHYTKRKWEHILHVHYTQRKWEHILIYHPRALRDGAARTLTGACLRTAAPVPR